MPNDQRIDEPRQDTLRVRLSQAVQILAPLNPLITVLFGEPIHYWQLDLKQDNIVVEQSDRARVYKIARERLREVTSWLRGCVDALDSLPDELPDDALPEWARLKYGKRSQVATTGAATEDSGPVLSNGDPQ